MIKPLTGTAVILLAALQYKLWLADSGAMTTWRLENSIQQQSQANADAININKQLFAEINALKRSDAAIEARARDELGMIKPDETFYQIVPHQQAS